jgi:hypothetical protein
VESIDVGFTDGEVVVSSQAVADTERVQAQSAIVAELRIQARLGQLQRSVERAGELDLPSAALIAIFGIFRKELSRSVSIWLRSMPPRYIARKRMVCAI